MVKIWRKSVDWFKRYSKNQYLGHVDLLFKKLIGSTDMAKNPRWRLCRHFESSSNVKTHREHIRYAIFHSSPAEYGLNVSDEYNRAIQRLARVSDTYASLREFSKSRKTWPILNPPIFGWGWVLDE